MERMNNVLLIIMLLLIISITLVIIFPEESLENIKPLYQFIKDSIDTIFLKPVTPLYKIVTNTS